jgi:integrase
VFAPHQDRGLLPRVKQQPWIPSDLEWDRLLEVVFQEASPRNQAMVLLAYEGALRRSELIGVGVADIDWPHDQITIRPETAKNASGRLIFYSEPTRELLSAYMAVRQQVLWQSGRRSSPYLFLSASHRNPGSGLSVEMWNKIVQRLAAKAQLPRFTTHTFRHLRLTDYARCKLELYEIALLAGHRNIESTRLYLHLSGTELSERVRQATQQIVATLTRTVEKARQTHV